MPFDCQKIAKSLTFFPKKLPKIFFFFLNCHWQFFWKKWKFLAFFWKKWIFLAIFLKKNVKFLTIFWHSNGNFPEGQLFIQRSLLTSSAQCSQEILILNWNYWSHSNTPKNKPMSANTYKWNLSDVSFSAALAFSSCAIWAKLKLIVKSHRFVPFGDNLTQFGCRIWHNWLSDCVKWNWS